MNNGIRFIKVGVLIVALSALLVAPSLAQSSGTGTGADAVFVGEAILSGGASGGINSPVSPQRLLTDCNLGTAPIHCAGRTGRWTLNITGASAAKGCWIRITADTSPSASARVRCQIGTIGGSISGDLQGGIVNDAVGVNSGLGLSGTDGAWCGASGGTNGGDGPNPDGLLTVNPTLLNNGVDTTIPGLTGATPALSTSVTGVSWVQSAGTLIVASGNAEDPNVAGDSGTIVAVVSALPEANNPANSCLAGTATKFTVVGAASVQTTVQNP